MKKMKIDFIFPLWVLFQAVIFATLYFLMPSLTDAPKKTKLVAKPLSIEQLSAKPTAIEDHH